MYFVDSHTHLYSDVFNQDIDAVMDRALQANVQKMLLPAIDSTTHEAMLLLAKKYPQRCFSMMGLHPCSVKEDVEQELNIVRAYLEKNIFVAIGEIGLDFYWDKTFVQQQKEAFELQMTWALEKNLPIVIHTREAMRETIEIVKPFAQKGLTGVFHCFGGAVSEAKQIMEMNFLLGIGGVLTYKKANLQELVKQIPLTSIVLETDAPYLTPVPYRGKRNESAYIPIIAEVLADAKGCRVEEVAIATSLNAEKLFRIK